MPNDGLAVAAATMMSPLHTALRCLFMIAMYHGVQLRPEHFSVVAETDVLGSILRILRQVGLRGRVVRRRKWQHLTALSHTFPVMALMQDGRWVIVVKATTAESGGALYVMNPLVERQGVQMVAGAEFLRDWSGVLVVCKADRKPRAEGTFGLRWFLPEILLHRSLLRDVVLAALMSALIAFATPLMFQILIDKVITHHSYQTLLALVVMFCTLAAFDGLFAYVRQYLMTVVTSKIDARLASRTFQHLLTLPLFFFEANTAGVLARNLQQTDTIRQFLTGRLLQTALDAVSLPLMLTVMVLYSGKLTALVLGFSLVMALVIGFMVPTFRRNLEGLYQAEGARQGHLVETIHGMRTVKSLALEPARQAVWNEKITAGMERRATVGRLSALAGVMMQGLEKLMQISVLSLGALEVFDGSLSIGALVAFNMVSGRVTGPLVQIVGLLNEYQETMLAVRMLGTVMSHPAERDPGHQGLRPEVSGQLVFDNVTFAYRPGSPPALDAVSFTVAPGQVIGVVGRSGSGKTTVTRLIQGIQTAQEGVIRLDGVDIRHIDLVHLRRSIGVVLQENFLFRGTLRENLSAVRPEATLEEIMEAARIAGADEFINRLPHSYDTMIEENGSNFSGGQRQRLAIARALLTRPNLLIFDEATSALDPESEAVIQDNLAEIARGRTLIIVSHRLTSLAGADAILVLEHGRVLDFAPHKVLLERCGAYQNLWRQQTKHFA
ncbi:peptidase domain-containing ABC transporter [Muricoccus aerilatus]|uniref:peptidase domain-containing ABC transporter n=1 Tax=Muricoccus aerilatus TaxID=452982 RepID=UPI000A56D3F7|nr:peptidase domain-containing ABC transporter [Roseomonas aerilata]